MKYGLVEFEAENKQTFIYLIKSPFIHIKSKSSENDVEIKTE